MKIEKIDFDKILVDDSQIRKDFQDIDNLIKSIVKDGLLEPLKVHKERGGYRLIDGERRYRALKSLITRSDFSKKIDCVVMPKPKNKTITQLITDVHKQKVSPIEEAEALKNLIEEDGLSIDQVSTMIGIERSRIVGKLKLLAYDTETREKISSGKISATVAQSLNVDTIKNKPNILNKLSSVGSDVSRAKELVAQEDRNMSRLSMILDRRVRNIESELDRIRGTLNALKNKDTNYSSLEYIFDNMEGMSKDALDKIAELNKISMRNMSEEDLQ